MNEKLKNFIAVRDRKLFQKGHYKANELESTFDLLLERKEINYGGRSSCGGKTDLTWIAFTSWNEIVKKAIALGYSISVESIKQPNKSPTMANGYWYENKYTLREVV